MVAIIGTALVAALVLLSINLDKFGFLHPSETYHAQFANAEGLRPGDDVRVAGMSVGSVSGVQVEGAHVRVDFTVQEGLRLGDASNASIEVATVLGQLFLQVESAGSGRLRPGATIPLARTTVPFTLITAFDQLGRFGEQTDIDALRTSLRTLATTLSGISPTDVQGALRGLADVSSTLAAKQQQVSRILTAAARITDTLNGNSAALVQVLSDSNAFLSLLRQRRDLVDSLLQHTAELGTQLRTFMQRNEGQLAPLLDNLNTVTGVLSKDRTQLQQAVAALGQFSVNIADATGSGAWLDLLSPVAVEPDNVIVGCGAHPDASRGPCQ
jgi:phospholipid/cholesterol/gamma-HCH transport system substrate-binding protein